MTTSEPSQSKAAAAEDKPTAAEASKSGQELPKAKAEKIGMITDIKNLYEGKPDNRGRCQWVSQYPDDIEEAAENAETARYALLIRNKKSYDGRKKLQIDSIVVQSPLLKEIFAVVLERYPGVTTGLARLTFTAPFQPFVHRWNQLVKAVSTEEDPETKAHLELFYKILEGELRDTIKARDDLLAHGVITFENIWMLFEPGVTVFSTANGEDLAARLKAQGRYTDSQCGRSYYLDCQNIDWDGEAFGYGSVGFNIWEFAGTASITRLSAFPISVHPNLKKAKEQLIKRGKEFEKLSGYHYKAYQGIATGEGFLGQKVKYNVDGRILIDHHAWNRFQPDKQISLAPLGKQDQLDTDEYCGSDVDDSEDYDDYYSDREDNGEDDEGKVGKEKTTMPLTDEQLLICGATLRGYSLKNKKWLKFNIASVKEIQWNETAFENLVLPGDHKELILALTESQRANRDTFDDIIQGKGKGMIMLLSGPPGVGKTLTAESVAETMRAPLYMMSAGDLGLDSSNVESSLTNVLEMANKWHAILLLDEADVFLEQRSAHDLERNKLVSIFLRLLEYYEGILFLTTNRVDNIDAAFQSRIHLSMEYHELSLASRRHVWSNFLAMSPQAHGFSDNDVDNLAVFPMNGREIKNVLKTAQLLASRKKEQLCYAHVNTVLSIEKRHIKRKPEIL